eukprot:scaffold7065_cov54-Phaeocystis_antarctica.AAC.1
MPSAAPRSYLRHPSSCRQLPARLRSHPIFSQSPHNLLKISSHLLAICPGALARDDRRGVARDRWGAPCK